MQFQSFTFLFVFLPITFALYSVTRNNVLSKWVIVLSSMVFYGWEEPWFILPMMFTGLLDYYVAGAIARTDDERRRKQLLVGSITINLLLLSVFKYTGWLTESLVGVGAFMGVSLMAHPLHLPLPPGISFYTFESMSYTIDVYRREFEPKKRLLDYLGFLVFFPHLVAGPIRRASQLLPVLSNYRPAVTAEEASRAFFMILFGLFLKLVLADNFGALVETSLKFIDKGTGVMPPGLGLVFAYGFAFQIYCDFAAYSTIARGVARLFKVELAHNFLTPYLSANPSEFWSRWHISLSTWLRDYLYIPLGGNRGGRLLTLRNLMLTMLIGGIWHGAGVFFAVWGLYHGLLLVLYRVLPIDAALARLGIVGRFVSVVLFFHLVCIGWIFFRADPFQFASIWGSILAAPGAFLAKMSLWSDLYLAKAFDIWGTLVAYKPYLGRAWDNGTDPATGLTTWDLTGAIATAVWERHLLPIVQITPRALLESAKLNPAFQIFGWELFVFAIPVVVTDWFGYRRKGEFPDLYPVMRWPVRVAIILLMIYAIQFYGRREGNAFIYFAF